MSLLLNLWLLLQVRILLLLLHHLWIRHEGIRTLILRLKLHLLLLGLHLCSRSELILLSHRHLSRILLLHGLSHDVLHHVLILHLLHRSLSLHLGLV